MDAEGFLYFIGRRDEMMKTSGYRVSPTEVEEVLYATKFLGECVHLAWTTRPWPGHPRHRHAAGRSAKRDLDGLMAACRQHMPAYMVPAGVQIVAGPLPRNPNGRSTESCCHRMLAWHASKVPT